MCPEISVFGIKIPGYGLMVFLGLIACFLSGFIILKFVRKEDSKVVWQTLGILFLSFDIKAYRAFYTV